MSSTDFRKNFSKTLDRVIEDCEPVVVVRTGKPATVHMSLEHYNQMRETNFLLRSPTNAKRLHESIEAAERGELLDKSRLFE